MNRLSAYLHNNQGLIVCRELEGNTQHIILQLAGFEGGGGRICLLIYISNE